LSALVGCVVIIAKLVFTRVANVVNSLT